MPIEKEKAAKSEQRDNGDIKECLWTVRTGDRG